MYSALGHAIGNSIDYFDYGIRNDIGFQSGMSDLILAFLITYFVYL